MRILHEKVEEENYLEILFDEKDLEHVSEFMIPTILFEFEGQLINLGVRLDLPQNYY